MFRVDLLLTVLSIVACSCASGHSGSTTPASASKDAVSAYQVEVTTAQARAGYKAMLDEVSQGRKTTSSDELGAMLPAPRLIASVEPFAAGDLRSCARRSQLKKEAGYTFWKMAACSWAPAKSVRDFEAGLKRLAGRANTRQIYACGAKRCITVPSFTSVTHETGYAECVYDNSDAPPSKCQALVVQSASGGVWVWAHTAQRVQTSVKRRGPPPKTTQFIMRAANADLAAIAKSVEAALLAQPLILKTTRSPSGNGFSILALAKARRSTVLGPVHENLKLHIKLFKPREESGVGVRMFVSLYVSRDRRRPIRRWMLPSARQRIAYERQLLGTLAKALKQACSACDTSTIPRVVRWD